MNKANESPEAAEGDLLSAFNESEKEMDASRFIAAGEYDKAIDLYKSLLQQNGQDDFTKASRYRKLANTYLARWDFQQSLPYLIKAIDHLKDLERSADWWREWIDLETDYCYALHNVHDVETFEQIAGSLKTDLENYGNNQQRIRYLLVAYSDLLRRNNWFRLPYETLTLCEIVIKLSQEEENRVTEMTGWNMLGFAYLWRGNIPKARDTAMKVLDILKTHPQEEELVRAYCTLAYSYRREGNIEMAVKEANKAIEAGLRNKNIALEKLNSCVLAWAAYKTGELEKAIMLAQEAYEVFTRFRHPFLAFCLMPMIAALTKKGDLEKACHYAWQVLHPETQKLPEAITTCFKKAIICWDEGKPEHARKNLEKAIQDADETGYL